MCAHADQLWHTTSSARVRQSDTQSHLVGLPQCSAACTAHECRLSRVVSAGIRLRLEVHYTGLRGWGVRCARNIREGEFVAEYVGEVTTNTEAVRFALATDWPS